ncbi:MAG: pyridoxamine 5'-phosphate oxidase [Planctomycetaceae bacterium]
MSNDPVYQAALERFRRIVTEAQRLPIEDPLAMALATVGADGRPTVRIVLLRGLDEAGLKFYTNIHSRKGEALAVHPYAAVCLHWEPLRSQIRVEGMAERTSDEDSDAYWAARPRESRIGAWASEQSQPLPDRQTLADRVADIEKRYPGEEIPRPPFWGGYRLIPDRIEFWHGQPARLHERDVYQYTDTGWTHGLLYP